MKSVILLLFFPDPDCHIGFAAVLPQSVGNGGEFSVDVHRIFKNFDADENDPASYIFEPTDILIKLSDFYGVSVDYILGLSDNPKRAN